ncbi:MerR family transcriptional regulator [Aporhodopirellula aestuarii]|uniref:MerR family transcriptional regulator n=1 Tax=Aporhodopirellula aestuarii TaxID=2950107 RepID=A0ABT0TYR0_9BACT|nr:MerR family transcriptional regulator [Aporhodopirellula aestuarii]MCM2369670.1 MerR family transcriptional regulator [Aporhodopirellula aestuarii]
MTNVKKAASFEGLVRVGIAAEYLGVSKETLRNWDKSGRLVPKRNPITGYRYYEQQQLERFRADAIAEREVQA